jgi:hypothetical protein
MSEFGLAGISVSDAGSMLDRCWIDAGSMLDRCWIVTGDQSAAAGRSR